MLFGVSSLDWRNSYRILVVIHLGRPRRIWGNDINMNLGEKDCEAENQNEMTVSNGGIK
jgi:hypothetical protein